MNKGEFNWPYSGIRINEINPNNRSIETLFRFRNTYLYSKHFNSALESRIIRNNDVMQVVFTFPCFLKQQTKMVDARGEENKLLLKKEK